MRSRGVSFLPFRNCTSELRHNSEMSVTAIFLTSFRSLSVLSLLKRKAIWRSALLTGVHVGVGGEKHTQPRLVIDRHAGDVSTAHVDAVREHECTRLGIEHVSWRGVHVASHQLEVGLREERGGAGVYI